jgi:hypothetical protein
MGWKLKWFGGRAIVPVEATFKYAKHYSGLGSPDMEHNAKNLQRTSTKLAKIILPHLKRPIACFEAKATATNAELH